MGAPEAGGLAWALTGSGHYLRECLGLLSTTVAERFDQLVAALGAMDA
jgi:flavoprotein